MYFPTPEQLIKAATMVAEAESVRVENEMLKSGLRLSDEEMDQARALSDLAAKSGDPSRFLAAMINATHKPFLIPHSCWWCRLRRWMRR